MDSDSYKMDYELTAQDYIDFNLYHFNHSGKMKKLLFVQRFILPLIYFAFPFVLSQSTNISFGVWLLISIAIYLVWIWIFPKRMKQNISKKLNRALKEEQNIKLLGKHSFSFNSEGISDRGQSAETKAGWGSIVKVEDAKDHFFIFISESQAFIIPKRAFAREDERMKFNAKINEMRSN